MQIDKIILDAAAAVCERRNSIIQPRPRFPQPLKSREEVFPVLIGVYKHLVELRGGSLILDEETTHHLEAVMKWLYERPEKGLLLSGSVGSGKTTMLKAISKVIGGCAYYTAQDIYDMFVAHREAGAASSSPVLFIDDLGAEPAKWCDYGEIRYPLTEVLYKRYDHNATTVISSNLDFNDISSRYGERVADRIREMFVCITYKGSSYRR